MAGVAAVEAKVLLFVILMSASSSRVGNTSTSTYREVMDCYACFDVV